MQRTTLRTLQRRSSRFGKRLAVIEAILLALGICASYGSAEAVTERCAASLPLRFTQLQAETSELRGIARENPEIEFERFALDFHCRLVLAILETGKNRNQADDHRAHLAQNRSQNQAFEGGCFNHLARLLRSRPRLFGRSPHIN
jgi:hypothetical protein